jgi:hypothetical protein
MLLRYNTGYFHGVIFTDVEWVRINRLLQFVTPVAKWLEMASGVREMPNIIVF